MRFHVRARPDEQPTGPWSRNELLELARNGHCGSWTWARAEGEELWRPLSDVIPIVPAVSKRAEPNVTAQCDVFRASGLGLLILGGLVAAVGILAAFAFDDVLWGLLCLLCGLAVGTVSVGMGIVVRAVAETLRVVRERIPRPGEVPPPVDTRVGRNEW